MIGAQPERTSAYKTIERDFLPMQGEAVSDEDVWGRHCGDQSSEWECWGEQVINKILLTKTITSESKAEHMKNVRSEEETDRSNDCKCSKKGSHSAG